MKESILANKQASNDVLYIKEKITLLKNEQNKKEVENNIINSNLWQKYYSNRNNSSKINDDLVYDNIFDEVL